MVHSNEQPPINLLRLWYLARLRKLALDEAEAFKLTPAALVAADEQAVERLITSRSMNNTIARSDSGRADSGIVLNRPLAHMGMVLSTVALLFLCFRLAWLSDWISAAGTLLVLSILMALFLSESNLFKRAEIMRQHIANMVSCVQDAVAVGSGEQQHEDAHKLLTRLNSHLAFMQERERLIADFGPVVVALLNAELQVAAVSPSCNKLWRMLPLRMLQRRLDAIIFPADWATIKTAFADARSRKEEVHVESRVQIDEQPALEMRWTIEWSETQNSYFVVAEDITREKQWQRMRELFLTVISHDLRSPLASIKFGLSMLRDNYSEKLDETGKTLLSSMFNTSEHLMRVVSDLVDINKIENSETGLEIQPSPQSLPEIVQDAVESVSFLAEQHGIKIEVSATDAIVNVDHSRVVRVLVNLLSNAIRFSAANSVVAVQAVLEANGELSLAVKDRGRGISAEDIPRIFDRFKQVEAEDATLKGGSGLGLTICKDIIKAHGGRIWAESQPEQGTTFFIRLPAAGSNVGTTVVPIETA